MVNIKKVVIFTAGRAATQIIDIFSNYTDVEVVGCLDDGEPPFYSEDLGVSVIGKTGDAKRLYDSGVFTHAIVAISTSIELRKKFYELCVYANIPLVNAIHPSCTICNNVNIGNGNVFCADTHIGTMTIIGDNNFISAKNNIEHHNNWGSHITTGPGVMTSGIVSVGDETKFGTGVFIQPFLKIGKNCIIGSQNCILFDIEDNMIMKTKVASMPVGRKS